MPNVSSLYPLAGDGLRGLFPVNMAIILVSRALGDCWGLIDSVSASDKISPSGIVID